MYRVVFEETGIAYDFPNQAIFKAAESVITSMFNGTVSGRERIEALCNAEGVSLLEDGSDYRWRRDWPERAAWCLAWSWMKPTPSSEFAVESGEDAVLIIDGGSRGVTVVDRNGRDDTAEALANAMLFANAADLLDGVQRLLAGDRKAKGDLAAMVKRFSRPDPSPAGPTADDDPASPALVR